MLYTERQLEVMMKVFSAFGLMILAAALAVAQSSTAELRGLVTDETGAVVPGAKVEVRGNRGIARVSHGCDGAVYRPAVEAGVV